MHSKIPTFGGGASATAVNPTVLFAVLFAGLLIWVLPRSKAIFPFMFLGILVPIDQVVVVAGLHFTMIRVLVIFGLIRVAWEKLVGRSRVFGEPLNGIDKAIIVLGLFTALDGVLLWPLWGEVVYQLGGLCSLFGVYFLLRYMIQDEQDVKRALCVLAVIALIVFGIMAYEYRTGRNLYYSSLGSTDSLIATSRGDSFRAIGCFAHPNIAGAFGGFVMPLLVGLWCREKRCRALASLGLAATVPIPFFTGSSTALFALGASLMGLSFWPLRRWMRIVRWSIVAMVTLLDIVMKAPVWQLVARVQLSSGSSSYHRYELINQCILHFRDWALIGTKDFGGWGWAMWDLADQYVATADGAGLIPLIAFLTILVCGFKYLGKARHHYEGDPQHEFFIWSIGAALLANVVAFFGITYWDQIVVPWQCLLVIISVVSFPARNPQAKAESDASGADEVQNQLFLDSYEEVPAATSWI